MRSLWSQSLELPRRRPWALAFVGFLLLLGAWSVAAPYSGTPDEREHLLRAASVATGQFVPRPSAALPDSASDVDVPASINRYRCWQFDPRAPAACAPEPGGDETTTTVATAAGRYHPVYYALVGWPLALWPNWAGILLARLISAALCAALLATALTDTLRWSAGRLAAVGVLIAVTPMTAQMGSAVNPNGLEIAAGVALFAAAVPLVSALRTFARERDEVTPSGRHHHPDAYPASYPKLTSLLTHGGLAAVALTMLRAAGPVWLLVSVLALLAPFSSRMLRSLWAWRAVRWWVLAIGAVTAGSVAWTVLADTANYSGYTTGHRYSAFQASWVIINSWPTYLTQAVGVMSWLDTVLPGPVYLIWEAVAAAVILLAIVLTDRVGRWRLAAVGVAAVIIPTALIVAVVNTAGFFTQGRYLLPVLVGLPILAAYLIAAETPTQTPAHTIARTAIRLTAGVLLALQGISLAYTMVRWQSGLAPEPGLHQLNPFAGSWHPPLGSVTPLLAVAVAVAVLCWLLWSITAAGGMGRPTYIIRQRVNEAVPGRTRETRSSPELLGTRENRTSPPSPTTT